MRQADPPLLAKAHGGLSLASAALHSMLNRVRLLRESLVVDHRHLPLPPFPYFVARDQVGHEVHHIDAAGLARVVACAAGGRRVYFIVGDTLLVDQSVRPDSDPLDCAVVLADVDEQK